MDSAVLARVVLVLQGLVFLVGCAATPKYGEYDPLILGNAMRGKTVVVQTGCPEMVEISRAAERFQEAYRGMGSQDSAFRNEMSREFWGGMMLAPITNRIELDGRCFLNKDTSGIYDQVTKEKVFLDTSGLDTTKLYLARSAIGFWDATSTKFGASPTIFTSNGTMLGGGYTLKTTPNLAAKLGFAVYDPVSRRIVYSRLLESMSNTNLLVVKVINQMNWRHNARSLGMELKRDLVRLFDLK